MIQISYMARVKVHPRVDRKIIIDAYRTYDGRYSIEYLKKAARRHFNKKHIQLKYYDCKITILGYVPVYQEDEYSLLCSERNGQIFVKNT